MFSQEESKSPRHMKSVIRIDKDGNVGFSSTMPIPDPRGENQMLVKVHSAPLNPSDLYNLAAGTYSESTAFPNTPGFEGSGTVIKVSEEASAHAKSLLGQNIGFFSFSGTYAEYTLVDATKCMLLPEGVSMEVGANSFVNPWSAVGIHERVK